MTTPYLAYIPTFTKVAERLSFSVAARDLGMTKSAVSKHISALEETLNVRLLNRTTRKLSITEEGRLFLDKCTHIMEELKSAEQQLQNLHTKPSGLLRINAPASFGQTHLAPMIAEFAAHYPDIRLEVDFSDQFIDIIESGVDVCIRIASLSDSSLIARKLKPCPMVLAASPAYLKEYGEPKHPDALINHRFVEYSHVERLREWRYRDPITGQEKVVPTTVAMRANHAEMLRQAALSGVGLVFAPMFILRPDVESGRLKALLTDYASIPERNIYALFPHNRFMTAKVRLFIDFIAERIGAKEQEAA